MSKPKVHLSAVLSLNVVTFSQHCLRSHSSEHYVMQLGVGVPDFLGKALLRCTIPRY